MSKTQRGPRVIADETRRATENASSPGLTYRNRFSPDCKNRGESFAPRHVATSRARLSRVTQAIVTIEGEKGEGELLSYETRETIKREREREDEGSRDGEEGECRGMWCTKVLRLDTRACVRGRAKETYEEREKGGKERGKSIEKEEAEIRRREPFASVDPLSIYYAVRMVCVQKGEKEGHILYL